MREAASGPRDRTRGPGGSLTARDSGGPGGRHRLRAKPCSPPAEEGPCRRRAGGHAAWRDAVPPRPRGSRSTGPRRSNGGQYLIRFGTEGRSEGRRLGYLCLQQQHVEVGDRLSVDAQELQFTSQSICQLSDLKLPGRKGRVKSRPQVASPGGCGLTARGLPRQTRLWTACGPSAWQDWDVPP